MIKNLVVLEITEKILRIKEAGKSSGISIDLILVPNKLKDKWLKSEMRIACFPILQRRKGKILFVED